MAPASASLRSLLEWGHDEPLVYLGPMIRVFFRSLWMLPAVIAAVLTFSVAVMAVVAARSLERFQMVHEHAAQLQRMRRAEQRITGSVLTPSSKGTPSAEDLVTEVEGALARDSFLIQDTNDRLREAAATLADGASASNRLDAVMTIERALSDEMTAHDDLLARVERDTEVELMLSTTLTVVLPLGGALLLYALRRRFLKPLDKLSELMTLLARKQYRTVSTTDLDPLIRPVCPPRS